MKRLLSASLLLALLAGLSAACAPVSFKGAHVAIASETALIVYDDKTQTEHFIRRGTFETKVPYFGFLVPTPSDPEVAEVSDEVFTVLADWTKPEVIRKPRKLPARGWSIGAKRTADFAAGPGLPDAGKVEVLGSGRVGDLDYVKLKADKSADLKEWLEKHSYETRPDLETWAEPYAKKGWVFTAFQMVKPEDRKAAQGLTGQTVRMSFKTDKPFYPYVEPEGQREAGAFKPNRLLRVFYVGTQRVEGKLEDGKKAWPGQAVWSAPIGEKREALAQKSKGKGEDVSVPEGAWLTEFEDRSAPRPGTSDLFFSPAADQSKLARPPVIEYYYVEDEVGAVGTNPARLIVVGLLGVIVLGSLAFLLWRSLVRKPE
jgi:hypothetical protein